MPHAIARAPGHFFTRRGQPPGSSPAVCPQDRSWSCPPGCSASCDAGSHSAIRHCSCQAPIRCRLIFCHPPVFAAGSHAAIRYCQLQAPILPFAHSLLFAAGSHSAVVRFPAPPPGSDYSLSSRSAIVPQSRTISRTRRRAPPGRYLGSGAFLPCSGVRLAGTESTGMPPEELLPSPGDRLPRGGGRAGGMR